MSLNSNTTGVFNNTLPSMLKMRCSLKTSSEREIVKLYLPIKLCQITRERLYNNH